jgi:hypothetical protein
MRSCEAFAECTDMQHQKQTPLLHTEAESQPRSGYDVVRSHGRIDLSRVRRGAVQLQQLACPFASALCRPTIDLLPLGCILGSDLV